LADSRPTDAVASTDRCGRVDRWMRSCRPTDAVVSVDTGACVDRRGSRRQRVAGLDRERGALPAKVSTKRVGVALLRPYDGATRGMSQVVVSEIVSP
jgi:hypothetical protein